jgi:hypothetical protein
MAVVKRIFRMVGTEGVAIRGVKRIFEREGLPTPEGKKIWGSSLSGKRSRTMPTALTPGMR